jgi:hypothetical protein
MVKRGWWLGLVFGVGACAQEERVVELPTADEDEPADEPIVRPVLEVLPDGSMITKRRVVFEPSVEEREAGRELSELTLSASDRALLEEFAAIQALYAQNSSEVRPQEAASPTAVPAIGGALFGLETRDHRLWLVRSEEGKRYTVTTKAGAIVAEEIDDATLGREFPELHELLHGAVDRVGDER